MTRCSTYDSYNSSLVITGGVSQQSIEALCYSRVWYGCLMVLELTSANDTSYYSGIPLTQTPMEHD